MMTKRERFEAAVAGRPVDRPPFAAWGPHMNMQDHHAGDFAKATCDYEENYEFDMIKVMPNGIYHTEDWGQEIAWTEDCDFPNFLCTKTPAFKTLDDWKNAAPRDVTKGAFAREVEAVRMIVDHFKGEVPVLATVASPIQTVTFGSLNLHDFLGININQMYLEDRLDRLFHMCEYFDAHEAEFRHLMDALTETTINLMQAFLDAGADGFFYAALPLRTTYITPENFERFVKPYDLKILDTVKDRAFTMLHIHGESDLMIDKVLDYPVTALNWEDTCPDNPSIAEMRAMTDKVLVAGLDRHKDLMGADRDKIKATIRARVEKAIEAGGPKLIISGGCEWPRAATYRFHVWKEVMDEFAK